MKKHILLLDESVTVQKVVSLTLDHTHYKVVFAKSKPEALQQIQQGIPSLILVSDQVSGVTSSFPKEVEAWLGRYSQPVPPCILISSREDTKEMRHFAGTLKKPFSPPQLKTLVDSFFKEEVPILTNNPEESQEQRLHGLFDEAFCDEEKLASETFHLQGLTAMETPNNSSSLDRETSDADG